LITPIFYVEGKYTIGAQEKIYETKKTKNENEKN